MAIYNLNFLNSGPGHLQSRSVGSPLSCSELRHELRQLLTAASVLPHTRSCCLGGPQADIPDVFEREQKSVQKSI